METWQAIVIVLFLLVIATAWINDKRESAQERKEFEAKVAANPDAYFVSQGGNIPDPIEEVAEETPVAQGGN